MRTFYIDHFTKGVKSISTKQKYVDARNYFIRSGLIITVFDLDEDVFFYSFTAAKKQNNPFDLFKPKGRLLNITYQDYKVTLTTYNEDHPNRDLTEKHFKQMWIDNYNMWLNEYYPVIKYRFL